MQPPEMQMYFNEEINPDGHLMYANRTVLTQTVDGKLVQPQTEPVYDEPGFGGVSGYPVSQVKLYFSHPMKHGYTVFVEDWSGAPTYTIHSSELEEADILPLAPYSARYRVSTTMYDEVDDEVYQMEFRFEVELPKL